MTEQKTSIDLEEEPEVINIDRDLMAGITRMVTILKTTQNGNDVSHPDLVHIKKVIVTERGERYAEKMILTREEWIKIGAAKGWV